MKDWLVVQCVIYILRLIFIFRVHRVGGGVNTWGLGFGLGLDSISYLLICLRFWISRLVISGRQRVKDKRNYANIFISINVILLVRLILRFATLDYLVFYICFERSLIPTLFLILG